MAYGFSNDEWNDLLAPRTVNMPLVERVFTAIRQNLDMWDQSVWYSVNDWRQFDSMGNKIATREGEPPCGTNMCFGGWAMWLSGTLEIYNRTEQAEAIRPTYSNEDGFDADIAAKLLGFNSVLRNVIFYSNHRDINSFEEFVRKQIAEVGDYNREQLDAWWRLAHVGYNGDVDI